MTKDHEVRSDWRESCDAPTLIKSSTLISGISAKRSLLHQYRCKPRVHFYRATAVGRAPSIIHVPVRSCSSRHAEHTLICVRPGTVQTAVMGAGSLATQTRVCTTHVPNMTTPLGSTFIISLSFGCRRCSGPSQPAHQAISGILDQVLTVSSAKNAMKRCANAGFCFVKSKGTVTPPSVISAHAIWG